MSEEMSTHVVTAPTGKMCAEKVSFLFFAGKTLGWVVEFLSTATSHNAKALARPPQHEIGGRIAALIRQVEEMRELHADWDSHGAAPPEDIAREVAKQVLFAASTLKVVPNRVAPSAQGGVGVCFYAHEKYADIEILNNGEILATTSDRRGMPQVWEVKPIELKGALDRIVRFVNS